MTYQEYKPTPVLEKYIDAYWTVSTGAHHAPATARIIPDTCADIIINLGSPVTAANNGQTVLQHEKTYLVGTMTQFCDTLFGAYAKLAGIRFKPFALHAFTGIALHGATNKTIELGSREFAFKQLVTAKKQHCFVQTLDAFFASRLSAGSPFMLHFLESIYQANGAITVADLEKKHFVTERQMERMCRLKAGITLKELCKQVRFRHTIKMLKQKNKTASIDDIAFETGYYDHSHLAKEIKKYTGHTPGYYSH